MTRSDPLVSIIIPTYAHRDFVGQAIESCLQQTFQSREIIVVNDGSPDDTAAVLRPYVESDKIRYVEQPNAGQGAARNRGIAEARGAFIALLDDDDHWPADKLAWQVQLLDAHPAAVLVYGAIQTFGDAEYRFPLDVAPSGRVADAFFRYNWIRSPGQTLIRASALAEVGGFDPAVFGADDWDLYLRLSERGEFIYQSRVALNYRLHAANASKNSSKMHRNALRVVRKHLGTFPKPQNWRQWLAAVGFVQNMAAADCADEAWRLWRSGSRSRARLAAWRAARLWPPAVVWQQSVRSKWLRIMVPFFSTFRADRSVARPGTSAFKRSVGRRDSTHE